MENCLIIGGGLSGLIIATLLQRQGFPATILDKGRGIGGRLATRRVRNPQGTGIFDYGAQYFTVMDPKFHQWVEEWIAQDVVTKWPLGLDSSRPYPGRQGQTCYRGRESNRGIAAHLAEKLQVSTNTRVATLTVSRQAGWSATTQDGDTMQRRILVLTPPLPQTLELLDQCQIRLGSDADVNQLRAIQYDKCLAVLLILKNPAKIPAPGGLAIGAQSAQLQSAQLRSAQLQSAQLQWATCNFQKGISLDCHAVTLEASPEFSEEYWDDRQAGGQLLIDEAQRLGLLERQDQVDFQVHGWRYSQTRSTYPHPYYAPDAKTRAEFNLSPLILAGDAFAPKSASCSLEGSFLSAWAAAEHILKEYA